MPSVRTTSARWKQAVGPLLPQGWELQPIAPNLAYPALRGGSLVRGVLAEQPGRLWSVTTPLLGGPDRVIVSLSYGSILRQNVSDLTARRDLNALAAEIGRIDLLARSPFSVLGLAPAPEDEWIAEAQAYATLTELDDPDSAQRLLEDYLRHFEPRLNRSVDWQAGYLDRVAEVLDLVASRQPERAKEMVLARRAARLATARLVD